MVGDSESPAGRAVKHVTEASAALLEELPAWLRLVRAPNPGPMTLDGTNSWVLRVPGAEACVLIDPGPLDQGHLTALAGEAPIAALLITHGHPDHREGVPRLVELLGAPVPVLAADADGRLPVTDFEQHGLRVTPLATPGHTADSICFLVEVDGEQVVFTGDTILGRGTTVVAYPDGDLGRYLDSLELLSGLGEIPTLPGHGPALADCSTSARFYLNHRLARLEQVRAARTAGASTAAEVVAKVYADVDQSLWWAAELSVHAQLAYLDGADRESGDPPARLDPP
jgi:glyoxylase-like metal-dependent hydrolase (beta-lactamase superfamily II)